MTFLDSDDAFLSGGLAWMVNVLRQRAPDLLMTPLQETGQPLDGTEVAGLFQDVVPLSTQQACDLFCEHQRLQGHFAGKCVTRQILLQHDLAAMECYEDMMTTPHWIVEAKSIVWGEVPVYAYYKRPGSLSDRGQTWRYGKEYIRALQSIEAAFAGRIAVWQTAHLWIALPKICSKRLQDDSSWIHSLRLLRKFSPFRYGNILWLHKFPANGKYASCECGCDCNSRILTGVNVISDGSAEWTQGIQ